MEIPLPENLNYIETSQSRILRKFFIISTILSILILILALNDYVINRYQNNIAYVRPAIVSLLGPLFILISSIAGFLLTLKKPKIARWIIVLIYLIWFLIQFRISPFGIGIILLISSVLISPASAFYLSFIITIEVGLMYYFSIPDSSFIMIFYNMLPFAFIGLMYSIISHFISRELYRGFFLYSKQNLQLHEARERMALVVSDQGQQIEITDKAIKRTQGDANMLSQRIAEMNSSLERLRTISFENRKLGEKQ